MAPRINAPVTVPVIVVPIRSPGLQPRRVRSTPVRADVNRSPVQPILYLECLLGTVMYLDIAVGPDEDALTLGIQARLNDFMLFADVLVLPDLDVVRIDARLLFE